MTKKHFKIVVLIVMLGGAFTWGYSDGGFRGGFVRALFFTAGWCLCDLTAMLKDAWSAP